MSKPVRILGIDPGFDRLGVAVIEKNGNADSFIFSTCIVTSRSQTFNERLLSIAKELELLIARHAPDELALETLFFTTNQKTAIAVAEVRGVCLYLAVRSGIEVFEYSPPQVKVAVTGYGKATKGDIAAMIPRLLKISLDPKTLDDEVDALAIALTNSAHRKTSLLSRMR
jgi:crossover junction endodeoxyribonuclease RuvC